MIRCLSLFLVLLILACPLPGEAQTKKSATFGERFKSLFTRSEKPAGQQAQKQPPKPVQVTTRSGSLRQPGPEQHLPLEEPATPTFAPGDVPLANQPPRRLETPGLAAKKLSTAEVPPARGPIRDAGVRPAAFESQPEKKTVASWFRGLWSRKDNSASASKRPAERTVVENRPAQPAADQSNSIDPRRVYRGPTTQVPPQDPRSGTGRGSDFSESGVPRSSNQFRGRSDTSF